MSDAFFIDNRIPGTTTLRDFTGLIDYRVVPADKMTIRILKYDGDLHLDQIPAHVKSLELNQCSGLRNFIVIAPHLEGISIVNCHGLKSLAGLPEGLKRFTIEHFAVNPISQGGTTVMDLIDRLTRTMMYGDPTDEADAVYDLSLLPRSVEAVKLKGLDELTSIEGLPERLNRLKLSNLVELDDLSPVPDHIQKLTIHNCRAITALPFREDLVELGLTRGCSRQGLPVAMPSGRGVIPDLKVRTIAEYRAAIDAWYTTAIARHKGAHTTR